MFKKFDIETISEDVQPVASSEANPEASYIYGILPHPPGTRYPFLSRDSADLLCETTDCYLNDKGFPSRCASPASVTLKNGKCQLYVQYLEKSLKT